MTARKPLKLPWVVGNNGYGQLNGCQIKRPQDGLVVAVTIGDVPELDAKAFAEFICRAVNSHEALVTALTAAEELIRERENPAPDYTFRALLHRRLEDAAKVARAALKGEPGK